MVDLISLGFGCEGEVDTIVFAVEEESVFKEGDISCCLDVTVFVEVDSHELFIC